MPDIIKITITCFSYVTEELDRVKSLIINIMPDELKDTSSIQIQHLQSQFRDKLKILTVELTKKNDINLFINNLSEKLDKRQKQWLGNNLTRKIDYDSHTVHLRLHKFKAFYNELEFAEGSDVIKVKIKYRVNPGEKKNYIIKYFVNNGLVTV